MRRVFLVTGIFIFAFTLISCNTNQNQHGNMRNDGRMGGGMMQGRSGQNGQSGMQGGLRQNDQHNSGQQSAQPLTADRARSLAQQYLESTGNTGFILGKLTETNYDYEFPLLTKSDSLQVAGLMVNKQTGAVSSKQ